MNDIEFKKLINDIGKELEEEGKTLLTINNILTYTELEKILNDIGYEKREKAIAYLKNKQINKKARLIKKILNISEKELKKEKPNQQLIQMGLDLLNEGLEEMSLIDINSRQYYKKFNVKDLDFIPDKKLVIQEIKDSLAQGMHPLEVGHMLGLSGQLIMYLKDIDIDGIEVEDVKE